MTTSAKSTTSIWTPTGFTWSTELSSTCGVLVVASGSCLVSEATDRLANRFGLDGEGIHLLLLVFV